MDNNFDKTENTEEATVTEIDSSDLKDSTNESEVISEKEKDEVSTDSNCEEPADVCDSTDDIASTSSQPTYPKKCTGDTIIVPKISFDEEAVEQLVENRETQKNQSSAKKKKKKKNHYALKTLIILLGFVLVFIISFFIARALFTFDNSKKISENQSATDISKKTTENSNSDEKVIQMQLPDDTDDGDNQAEPIKVDDSDDTDNKSTNGNSSNTNNNSSNTSNKNNSTTQNNNSNKNTVPVEETEDDGNDSEIILPGTPSDDEESTGSAGIELE